MPMISAMMPLKGYRLTKHLIRSIGRDLFALPFFYRGVLWRYRLVGDGIAHPGRLPHVGPISMAYLLTVVQLEYSHVYFCKARGFSCLSTICRAI